MHDSPAFSRIWYARRLLLRAALFAWFFIVVFCIGPPFLFWYRGEKPAPKSPADFTAEVTKYCVPVIRKMKAYERLNGLPPTSLHDIGAEDHRNIPGHASLDSNGYEYESAYNRIITYDFTLGNERWMVRGTFVNGVIPVPPPAEPEPVPQPSTQA